MRKTKIIATLGPVSNSYEMVKTLIQTGMNAARINFSHGSHESHSETINVVKKVREELGIPIPLILDTKGPEIRTKSIKGDDNVTLNKDSIFTITTDDIVGDETRISVTYSEFAKDLSVGNTILIDDGLIELTVQEIKGNDVICKVINTGVLGANKGVNLPNVKIKLPALTEKDIADIKFGIKMGFDYIAASFIRSASDVLEIRKVLEENDGSGIKIISKIENREGADNINEILKVTDGIMVARGDLGVEIPLEEVPIIQKELIRKCKRNGKLVITATQMLESMITNPRPTRAEANDVANAIFDGTDAIMLSGETAKGSFPVQSVDTMVRIAKKIESSIDYVSEFNDTSHKIILDNITNAVSHATCTTANDLNAKCITAVSNTGFTVNMVSKYRPNSPILALTPNEMVQKQLNLVWGCYPVLVDIFKNTNDLFEICSSKALEYNFAQKGDTIVIVGGTPIGCTGSTNTLKAVKL